MELVGLGGTLPTLTKAVPETALEVELADHPGYDRHDLAGRSTFPSFPMT